MAARSEEFCAGMWMGKDKLMFLFSKVDCGGDQLNRERSNGNRQKQGL